MRCPIIAISAFAAFVAWLSVSVLAADPAFSKLVFPRNDGALSYKRYTEHGDTIPDFSHCGYGGGGVAIPDVPVQLTLAPASPTADDLPRIQEAIDKIGRMPLDATGFRGTLLLKRGTYRLHSSLRLATSGVVLRGEGDGEQGTVLFATFRKPQPLIVAGGSASRNELAATRQQITSSYVPSGSRVLEVEDASKFSVGDQVLVTRRGDIEWLHEIEMDRIPPRPNQGEPTRPWKPFDLDFDRIIIGVRDKRIAIDAPIACAIDDRWGGGQVNDRQYTDRRSRDNHSLCRVPAKSYARNRPVGCFGSDRADND